MMSLIIYPALGFFCGLVSSAIAYALVRQRWAAYLVAILAPLPALYLIIGFGLAFMRDETLTMNTLFELAALVSALTLPFSLLAAWVVCHRRSRPL